MATEDAVGSGREIVLRCREPFSLGVIFDRGSVAPGETRAREVDSDGDPPMEAAESDGMAIIGVASSTSVDSHGTEMSLDALTRMAEQMRRGVPLLPRHNNGSRAVEWDEVIGRTTGAEIERADVMQPGADGEAGYRLRLTSMLYSDDPMVGRLMSRLDRGEPIGQSIGGWFLSVRVVESDSGEIERVIVEDVELDHVALTRAPSNPDSLGLASLRSRVESLRASASVETDSAGSVAVVDAPVGTSTDDRVQLPSGLSERHVIAVEETDSEVVVRFAKTHSEIEAEVEVEVEDTRSDSDRAEHSDPEEEMADHSDPEEMADHSDPDSDSAAESSVRANPEAVSVDDFVRFIDSVVSAGDSQGDADLGGEIYGQVSAVVTEGSVSGAAQEASEEDPILRIAVWGPVGDGYEPTGESVAVPVSSVEKIDPLPAPTTDAEVEASVDAPAVVTRATPDEADFPLAPKETEWSWDADAANEVLGDPPDWSRFQSVHLYFDPDRSEVRAGYKLPVAKVIDGEIHLVFRGLVAAVAALNGARGGVDLSDEDRKAAYDLAASYYGRFEEEAPPLRSADSIMEDDRSSSDPLDMRRVSDQDIAEATGQVARAVEATVTSTSNSESQMTPADLEALRAMIREEVARSAAPSAEPATAVSPNPASPAVDESDALRSELERLRATVDRLSSQPIRRGLAYQTDRTSTGRDVGGAMGALIERTRGEAPAIASVMERASAKLDSEKVSPRDLGDALAAVLRTAESEGILGNPNPAHWA